MCPPQLGVWGLAARKKNQFCAKNYAILSKLLSTLLVLLSYITAESGGIIPPVLKVGGPIPLSPPAPTPLIIIIIIIITIRDCDGADSGCSAR